MNVDFTELDELTNKLAELARNGKIEWGIYHEAAIAKNKLFSEAINLQNKIEQINEAYRPVIGK